MRRAAQLALDALRGRLHPRDAVREIAPRLARRAATRQIFAPGAPALVLSPHLDDAVLSCWSALVAPGELLVANLFSGRPAAGVLGPYDRIAGASESAMLIEARELEDRAALSLAGRTPTNLGFLETQYRRHAPAVDELLAALVRACPAARVAVAPAAIGLHPDHLLARRLGLALRDAGVPLVLYADLPYCVSYGWPEWVTGQPRDPNLVVDASWATAFEPIVARGIALEREVHVLDPAQRSAKLAALRRYTTQYATLTRGPLDVLANPAVLGFEVSWRVR